MINLSDILTSREFEEYFLLREKNPKIKSTRFKTKFSKRFYVLELTYQSLKQDFNLN